MKAQGSHPMGSPGLPRDSLPWGIQDPLPCDPLGSQGFPLPWVPSHGIPLNYQGSPPMGSHPTSPYFFVWPGRKSTAKELTRSFLARSLIEEDKRARRWAPPKPVGFLDGRCHRVRVKLARILPSTAEESARANATQTK